MINQLHQNIDLTQQFFSRYLAKEIYEQHGIVAWYSGIDNKNFNSVIAADIEVDQLDKAMTDLIEFYKTKKVPWSWILTPFNKPANLQDVLLQYGFEFLCSCTAMVGWLENLDTAHLLRNYDIREVTDIQGMTDWINVLNDGFGAEEQDKMSYRDLNTRVPYGDNHAFHHYVLYQDKLPVTAGTLSVSSYGARIDDIATCMSYQRQGLASAMTLYIMQEAKRLGYQWCCLDASDQGLLLYQKLGYEICYESKIYGYKG